MAFVLASRLSSACAHQRLALPAAARALRPRRRAAARLAFGAAREPARPGPHRRRIVAPPELRRDGASTAKPRAGVATRRRAGDPAARAEYAADRRRLCAEVSRDGTRRAGAFAGAARDRVHPEAAGTLSGVRAEPALGSADVESGFETDLWILARRPVGAVEHHATGVRSERPATTDRELGGSRRASDPAPPQRGRGGAVRLPGAGAAERGPRLSGRAFAMAHARARRAFGAAADFGLSQGRCGAAVLLHDCDVRYAAGRHAGGVAHRGVVSGR